MGALVSTISEMTRFIGKVTDVEDSVKGFGDLVTGRDRAAEAAAKNAAAAARAQANMDAAALRQLQEKQKLEQKQARNKALIQQEKNALESRSAEEARLSSLRRAMARQNAQFGGSGVSLAGGSGEAVLLGLYEESDAERKRREGVDALRTKAMNNDLSALHKKNLLQFQQEQERQRLARLV